MWAWIRTPRGSTTTALVVAVVLALLWFDPWTRPLPGRLSLADPSSPADTTRQEPEDAATRAGGPARTTGTAPMTSPSETGATTGSKATVVGTATDAARRAPASDASPGGSASQASGTGGGPAGSPALPDQAAKPETSRQPDAAPAPGDRVALASPGAGAGTSPSAPGAGAAGSEPGFDVVRVEPDGSAVVAGRGEPGSDVTLMDGDKPIATAKVDSNGQFAILPSLNPGDHVLALRTKRGDRAPVHSSQSVAVSLAKQAGTRPLVALLSPDKPAEILSDGGSGLAAGGQGSSKAAPPATAQALAIQAVEARQAGQFNAAGVARPGSSNRVYLNGSFVAEVTAGPNGRWSVEVQKGMTPGHYQVRADQVEPASGKVLSRVEVPFDYPDAGPSQPTRVAQASGAASLRDAISRASRPAGSGETSRGAALPPSGGGRATSQATPPVAQQARAADAGASRTEPPPTPTVPQPSSSGTAATAPEPAASAAREPDAPSGKAAAVVADLRTKTVERGESLWRISRKLLGRGVRYTEIYASNAAQIRDPALIYPGQVFVMPQQRTN